MPVSELSRSLPQPSRRRFLRGAAYGAGALGSAAFIAACGGGEKNVAKLEAAFQPEALKAYVELLSGTLDAILNLTNDRQFEMFKGWLLSSPLDLRDKVAGYERSTFNAQGEVTIGEYYIYWPVSKNIRDIRANMSLTVKDFNAEKEATMDWDFGPNGEFGEPLYATDPRRDLDNRGKYPSLPIGKMEDLSHQLMKRQTFQDLPLLPYTRQIAGQEVVVGVQKFQYDSGNLKDQFTLTENRHLNLRVYLPK